MVAKIIRSILILSALLLASCQTVLPTQTDRANSAGEDTQGVQIGETKVAAGESSAQQPSSPTASKDGGLGPSASEPAEPAPSPDQVVLSLQQQALKYQSEGRWSEAEQILERALRIDADKVDLYHQLATVRMGQQRFAEAEQIALKGLTLTNQTADHKASLWEVIAQCRSAQSDIKGANEARDEMLKWMTYE